MAVQLLILADDFTGALDSAVPFAKRGLQTEVSVQEDRLLSTAAEVFSLDVESRHLSPTAAKEKIGRIAEKAKALRIPAIYNKVDSALRGNIGAEFEALLTVFPMRPLVFAPAFPQLGRTVRQGILSIDGIPVHQTKFGEDLLNPVLSSSIPEVISLQTAKAVRSVAAGETEATGTDQGQILVFDGETPTDLERTAALFRKGCVLLAGNAGFAAALAAQFPASEPKPFDWKTEKPVLVLCGSLHETSRKQVAQAEQAGFLVFGIPAKEIEQPDFLLTHGRLEQQVRAAFSANRHVVLHTVPGKKQMAEQASRVSGHLGQFGKKVIQGGRVGALIVFGGDTLFGLMESLRVSELRPLCEIEPGVVASIVENDAFSGLLVSKAGAFGSPDLLQKILLFLQ